MSAMRATETLVYKKRVFIVLSARFSVVQVFEYTIGRCTLRPALSFLVYALRRLATPISPSRPEPNSQTAPLGATRDFQFPDWVTVSPCTHV